MNTRDHLRRSKSTRSIRTSQGSFSATDQLSPDIARLHAMTAASRAMSRSTNRSSTLTEGSYGRLGGPHSMAVPQRRHHPSRSSYPSEDIPAADEPSTHESAPVSIEGAGHEPSWSTALPSISEFGGLEDRISSLPSSYRRLRKTRSMFSTRQHSSWIPHRPSSPDSCSSTVINKGVAFNPPKFHKTLRRSMSFLGGNGQPPKTLRHAKSHDVSVELARHQYEQNATEFTDPPRRHSAYILHPKREHRPFRKTFRTANPSEQTPIESPQGGAELNIPTARRRARSISSSIKKGLKRVLGLSKTPHGRGQTQESPSSGHHWNQALSPAIDGTTMDCLRDGLHSLKSNTVDSPADHHPPPTIRRMQSSASLATTRSRVTSWADSTVANTIATPRADARKHISVIGEQRSPSQETIHSFHRGTRPGIAIDSRRLFSALMKQVSGASAAQSPADEMVVGHVKEHRAVPTEGSLHLHRSSHTIRQIASNESITSPGSFATASVGPITPQKQIYGHNSRRLCETGPPQDIQRRKIIDAAPEEPETSSDSASVYSRTTSGNSPNPKTFTGSPHSGEEPGIATIFASQRVPYSSPAKASQPRCADVAAEPGTDWQSWMNSQMAIIENTTPTRHYRENAQIQDDEELGLPAAIPARKVRIASRSVNSPGSDREGLSRKLSTSSNFSRPFSRSSSARTIVMSPKHHQVPDTFSPSVPLMAPEDVFQSSNTPGGFLGSSRARESNLKVPPMRSRPSNQSRVPECPTATQESTNISPKMGRGKHPVRWSPGSQGSKAFPRRSARYCRENRMVTNENSRIRQGQDGHGFDPQSPISSKHMVEMFLSSRRRQMGADMSDDGDSEVAFI
ncbi:hypothetical protein ARAM_006254 [Aspergillus rambellii]|uniref:Uncharacterized protein n=1 Tax=Aspergillus rambellii TaxID=308745 RepID=A0A0F8W808_9EURO|nr:hypothetical protein ARAM_006254 [Aspergillus rambellii]